MGRRRLRPFLTHLGHQLAVLGVHSGDGADVLAVLQNLEELAVSQHEHVLIGHEHLEGVHPFFPHQRLHLGLHLQGRGRGFSSICLVPVRHLHGRGNLPFRKSKSFRATERSSWPQQYLGSPPSDAHMQSVVAAGLGVGGAATFLVGLQQGLVPLRQNVSDHHGGASRQGSLGEKSPGHPRHPRTTYCFFYVYFYVSMYIVQCW